MTNIIISAHGGRWSNQQQDLRLPAGSTVIYYVNDGGMLSNQDGYAILGNLEAGQQPGGNVAQTVAPGGYTYDYACWYAPEFAADCGIYQVGSTARLASLQAYTEAAPLQLSTILATYPNCTIYWVCCREISTPPAKQLTNTPGAFPSGRPADLRRALHAAVDRFCDTYLGRHSLP